jgi:myo-inositol-1(or 4)-monophosphatase
MQQSEVRALLNEICDLIEGNLNQIQSTRYNVTIKEDGTPVTDSDLFIENLVRQFLSIRLPNVVFIGEESFDFLNKSTDSFTVLLDPIDGTENFCSGLKEWGVSFGLWHKQKHLGSFLHMPELGVRVLTGDSVEPISSRITGLSSSISSDFFEIMSNPGEYRIFGCAVYNIYNVIRGSFKRFINPKGAYVWDILPGTMLALEQGCRVLVDDAPYNGTYLDPSRKYRITIER